MRHSSPVLPPSTLMVMNLVAPSPSRTMACASCLAMPSIAVRKVWPSGLVNAVIGVCLAWLLATTTNESLVDVSPSTVTRLNEPSASSWASCPMTDCETQASVAIKPSMVAIFGRIMPAPLLIPVIVTGTPPSVMRAEKALATVSVVMMASAALAQLLVQALAMAAGKPASIRS